MDFRRDLLPLAPQLYRLALRMLKNTADAEDAVQETLLRAWDQRDDISLKDSPQAFVLTVCRNLCLDMLGKSERQSLSLDGIAEQSGSESLLPPSHAEPSADESLLREERCQRVRRAIDLLPSPQREAVQLRDIEELPYQQCADILHLTLAAFKTHLHRARLALHKTLSEP